MTPSRPGGGPQLPYRPLAGVIPCGPRWLVAGGRLQGITLTPAEPMLLESFIEVLDYRPAFEIIALACPIGLPETGGTGRACDAEARRLVGVPRSGAILTAPSRAALHAEDFLDAYERNGGMSIAVFNLLSRIAEVDDAIAPYWQRTVFEVHPELSFYQLNDDTPLKHSKHTYVGRDERRGLLERRLPLVDKVLDARLPGARPHHVIDAAACLWTARRIASKSVARLPHDPVWDQQGLRMEIVR